ncbi:MAG: MBL fold metallo-hydrolase, partial [Promethearchaeota archaeon]
MSFEFVEKLDFDSEFFSLYKLSDGVFAAICKENSGMGSNAGFIDLGDFSLMIDTTIRTKAAEDLKRASINFTGKIPKVVIITHYHLDHVIGNSIFDPSTLIITSDRTLNNIKTENQKRIEELKNVPLEEILKMEKSLETEKDEEKRQDIENDLRFIRSVQEEDFSLRDPNLTFKEEFKIYGETRNVLLKTFKKAHTDGDVIVYVPNDKILFAGDLLFARTDPWLGSGDPEGWKSVIDDILELDFKIVIPGHGELASKKEFSLQKDYITEIV